VHSARNDSKAHVCAFNLGARSHYNVSFLVWRRVVVFSPPPYGFYYAEDKTVSHPSPKKVALPIHLQTVCFALAAPFLFLGLSEIRFSSSPRLISALIGCSSGSGWRALD
jgi:hypothetical protein